MNNIHIKTEQCAKEEYNKIPVHYCKECLSLNIRRVTGIEDACYCDECGSTDIEETNIYEWENIYKEKHGFTYLNNLY